MALKRRRPSDSVQVRRYRQFNDYRFPPGSRSGLIIDTLAEGFRVAMDEGPRSLLERLIER